MKRRTAGSFWQARMMDIGPTTLTGRIVRLEPLSLEHAPGLWAVNEADTWTYLPYGAVDSFDKLRDWVSEMLRRQGQGADLPFAIVLPESSRPIGATRYMTIDRANRSLEIGGSWLGAAWRRTGANTEAKYLLLRNAFETWGCLRVQFRTDLRNERSQRAIQRLGAVREAVFRKYSIMPDGYQRSSVFYSVIDDDWPAVRTHLEGLLAGVTAG
jgi:RimJ/RimL family protein N-acetyltransferase